VNIAGFTTIAGMTYWWSWTTPPSAIYYAQLVEEESTLTVMAALKEVIERKGLFCA
jgi:hypothetical protein